MSSASLSHSPYVARARDALSLAWHRRRAMRSAMRRDFPFTPAEIWAIELAESDASLDVIDALDQLRELQGGHSAAHQRRIEMGNG